MAADFPVGEVFVAGCHDAKNWDAHCLSFEFKGLSKGCHKEQEEDRHHVVPLMYSYTLRDLCNLIFDLQHAGVVVVDPLNGSCRFRGGGHIDTGRQSVACDLRYHMP